MQSKLFRLTARSVDTSVREPFVDWFEVDSSADAVTAWKAQAEQCGIAPGDIELVSVVEFDPLTMKPLA